MYDIRDILDKGIKITEKIRNEYIKLQEDSGDMRMRILIGVFIRSANNDISYYQRMKMLITDSEAEMIDFGVFDKISNLINQYSRTILPIAIYERRQLVNYALSQQKSLYALLLDIQGRMVVGDEETSIAYYVLLELIQEKLKFINELEQMVQ